MIVLVTKVIFQMLQFSIVIIKLNKTFYVVLRFCVNSVKKYRKIHNEIAMKYTSIILLPVKVTSPTRNLLLMSNEPLCVDIKNV